MANKTEPKPLTQKQQVFCDLYRASGNEKIRGNAKQCYMIAFAANAKSAEHNGPRLINKNPSVKSYLAKKREEAIAKFDIQEADLLREAAGIAFLDPADFYDKEGRILPIHAMPERARRAISGLDVSTLKEFKKNDKQEDELQHEETITSKIKFIDKKSTIELLMKYKKMLSNDNDVNLNLGGVLLVPQGMTAEQWQKQNSSQSQKT